jgi:hypothetical protein
MSIAFPTPSNNQEITHASIVTFFVLSDLAAGLLVAETLSDSIKANVNAHRVMTRASYPSLLFRKLMSEPKPKPKLGRRTFAQTTVDA